MVETFFLDFIFINVRTTGASEHHMLPGSMAVTEATAVFYCTALVEMPGSLHAQGMRILLMADNVLSLQGTALSDEAFKICHRRHWNFSMLNRFSGSAAPAI
jgi:hypothetical protein